jgi:hypothetical protein
MNFMQWMRTKGLRRLFWVLSAVLVLWGLSWAVVPGILKSQIEARGSEALGRKLTLRGVDFRPWTLELTLSDLRIASADGASNQLAIARIYVDAEIQSLLRFGPVLDAVIVDAPEVHLTHLGKGRFDIDDILQRLAPKPDVPPSAPLRFALYNLVLQGGSIDFVDQSAGRERKQEIRKLDIAVPFLSNLDSQREVTVQPRLAFELNGSAFDSAASATPFASKRQGEASLQITHFDIAPYLSYLPPGLPVQLRGAVLDTSLKLNFAQTAPPSVSVSGGIRLSKIQVADPQGGELLTVGSVQAVLKDVRPLEHHVELESLEIVAPSLHIARDRNGRLNLPSASSSAAPATAAAASGTSAPPVKPASASESASATPAAAPWKLVLATLGVRDGSLSWSDSAVPGTARLALSKTDLSVKDIRWPMDAAASPPASAASDVARRGPVQIEGSATLDGGKGSKPAQLHWKGEGTDRDATVNASLSDFSLGLLAPYVQQYLIPRVDGVLAAQAQVLLKDGALQFGLPQLSVSKLTLTPPPGNTDLNPRELPSLASLEVQDVRADTGKRSVLVGKVSLRTAQVRVQRGEDGQWMYSRWLRARDTGVQDAPASAASTSASSGATASTDVTAVTDSSAPAQLPWTVSVADIALDESTVVLIDRLQAQRVFVELSALKVHATAFAMDGKKPMPLQVSTKVRSARTDYGTLKYDGVVQWDPVVAQGTVEAVRVPLQAAAPYLADRFNVELVRADGSFKGQIGFAQLPQGPTVRVEGDASVGDLVANSVVAVPKGGTGEPSTEELLNWKLLAAPGIDLTMVPGTPLRMKVREIALSDFFARLIINPQGRLVLQDLVKTSDVDAAAAPVSAGSAPSATATADAAPTSPFIEFGPISVLNGRVAFSDRFVKPNYSADLSELTGRLGAFNSRSLDGAVQMADLELRGRAEGTAALEVVGKVNPLAKPLALDIRGKVRDLELSPLSSYAVKYAGYGIERGKLSVDVNYVVLPNGQLTAANKIILSQLTFGEKAPGATSSLPVKLAVALLADRQGVIDLDLPVSGSLNDPQFRIWPVVWKIIGNLITKALTSPFSLFAGGGDGAETLSTVAFEPGTDTISSSAQTGLDQIAKSMREKPSLHLTIIGNASLEQERNAIERARLNTLVLQEARRQAAEAGKDVTTVTAVSAESYPDLLQVVYRRADIKKPRNLVGMQKTVPVADMEALLMGSMTVNEDAARELARRRSVAVREYLTARQLPSTQLFLGADKLVGADTAWKAQAELELGNH